MKKNYDCRWLAILLFGIPFLSILIAGIKDAEVFISMIGKYGRICIEED